MRKGSHWELFEPFSIVQLFVAYPLINAVGYNTIPCDRPNK